MRIVFVTDLHAVRQAVAPLVDAHAGADLLILGGDMTNFGGAAEVASVVAPLRRAFGRVYAVPGNTDTPDVLQWLEDEGLSLHGRGRLVEGLWISGLGGSNHTPLRAGLEHSEERIAELLAQGAPPADGGIGAWLLVSHVPPVDTAVDRMILGAHVGSRALRTFLEEHRPELCLCGHIHEAVGNDEVGGTEVCNPGAFSAGRYAVVDWNGERLQCERAGVQWSWRQRARATTQVLGQKLRGLVRLQLNRRRRLRG